MQKEYKILIEDIPFDGIWTLQISSFSAFKSCTHCFGVICVSVAVVTFIMLQLEDSIFVLVTFLIGISLLILSCFQRNMTDLIFDDNNCTIYLQNYGWTIWNERGQTIEPLGEYHDFKKMIILKSKDKTKGKYRLKIKFYSADSSTLFDKHMTGHTKKYYLDKVSSINQHIQEKRSEMLINGYYSHKSIDGIVQKKTISIIAEYLKSHSKGKAETNCVS